MKNNKLLLSGILLVSLIFSGCSFIVNPMIKEANGESSSSSKSSTSTSTCDLAQPIFSVTPDYYGYIIAFGEVNKAKYYAIYRNTTATFSSATQVTMLEADDVNFTNDICTYRDINTEDFTFTESSTYYYWVVACNKKKAVGDYSSYKSGKYTGGVKNLTFTLSSNQTSAGKLTWNEPDTDFDPSYRIYKLTSASAKPEIFNSSSVYSQAYSENYSYTGDLLPTVTYYFWVVPYNTCYDKSTTSSTSISLFGTGSNVQYTPVASADYNPPVLKSGTTYTRDMSSIKFTLDVTNVQSTNSLGSKYYAVYYSKTSNLSDAKQVSLNKGYTDSTAIELTINNSNIGISYSDTVYFWFFGAKNGYHNVMSAPSAVLKCDPYGN